MASVSLESVSKQFPNGNLAVDGISIEIKDQEFLVFVGPSGCGKTTTMRLIAGLETGTNGVIKIDGSDVSSVAPKNRDVAMVFQDGALCPHLSVYKNLSFGLTLRLNSRFGGGVLGRGLRKIFQPQAAAEFAQSRNDVDDKVRQTALRLGIEHLLDRKPHQLSGGERQRVALGRAIVRKPAVFLFDEPLSSLDSQLRQQLRGELKRLHRDLDATMIYVTHDQVEAMTLGDRVAVMNDGKILQVGSPLEIYQQPANLFVAKFMGSVPLNVCRGTVKQNSEGIWFDGGFQIKVTNGSARANALNGLFVDGELTRDVTIGFRAEDVALADQEPAVSAIVEDVDCLGDSTLIHTRVCGQDGNLNDDLNHGHDSRHRIVARLAGDSNLVQGESVRLSVDWGKVLWFDPVSGENLLKERT